MNALLNYCKAHGLRAEFRFGAAKRQPNWDGAVHNWRVTLHYQRRRYSFDYFGGALVTNPNVADVLSCLVSDADGVAASNYEFCTWADDYGYEHDQEAKRIFAACKKQDYRIRKLLGDDYEEFAQACDGY